VVLDVKHGPASCNACMRRMHKCHQGLWLMLILHAGVRSSMEQSKHELLSTPGVAKEQDASTQDFIFQQTMCGVLFLLHVHP